MCFKQLLPGVPCYLPPENIRPTTLLQKRLWHRSFSATFAKFLGHLFNRTPLDDCCQCSYIARNQSCVQKPFLKPHSYLDRNGSMSNVISLFRSFSIFLKKLEEWSPTDDCLLSFVLFFKACVRYFTFSHQMRTLK